MKKIILLVLALPLLFLQCSSQKKLDILGVYYRTTTPYADNEIIKNVSQIAFANNYATFIKGYENKPELSMIKRFNDKRVRYLVLEDHDLKNISTIYRFTRYKKIFLSLITSATTSQADAVYLTDYAGLGYNLVNQIFATSRAKRNTFVIYYKNDHKQNYYKNKLQEGYQRFFAGTTGLIHTNRPYSRTNYVSVKQDMASFLIAYNENLRGILTDDDSMAEKIILYLKSINRDGELQVASFGAGMEGVNTIIKIGFCVTGDMNRYELFNTAVTNALKYSDMFSTGKKERISILPGVLYNQFNILENLALTRKYSIQQLMIMKE